MKKFNYIELVMVFAIVIFLLVGVLSVVNAQVKIVGEGITIEKAQYNTIEYIDGSKDKLYQNTDNGGVELVYVPKATLILNEKEYKQFVKDINKASKRKDIEIVREKYTINSYTWSDDSVYFSDNKTLSVGEIFLVDIEKIK